jgi:glycolate oxidase FAD binding subunit
MRVDLVLSLERLAGIVDHAEADATLTVQAGATLADVDARLAKAGQWLPFDPPFAARTTIGGLVAANAAGPARQRFGTVRESLLGLRAFLADGTAVKSGGRVVKNVAGYDVHRLLVGSCGTLAVIVEASFKLQPRPEVTRALRFTATESAALFAAAAAVARSNLGPLALEVVCEADARAFLEVVLAGFGEEVDESARRARELAGAVAGTTESPEAPADETAKRLEAIAAPIDERSAIVRIGVPPAGLGGAFDRAVARAASAAEQVEGHAHAGVGVLRLRLGGTTRESLAALVGELRRDAAAAGGYLVAESLPGEWKRTIDVWGKPAAGLELMRGVKRAFDPKNVLAPGRFVEGV